MTDFLTYLHADPGRSTAEYAHDFAIRRRLGHSGPWLPASDAELEAWLAALAKAGRIVEREGVWEPTYCEEPAKGMLFI
jgi:hypothetical protein